MAEELASENRGKKFVEYVGFLHFLGNHISHFLPEKTHIHPSLPFINGTLREDFPIAADISGQL